MKKKDRGKAFRITGIVLMVYLLLMVLFWYLTGDQLKFRESRSEYTMETSDTGSLELTDGVIVEQDILSKVQRFKTVSIQFGTYLRENSGTVHIEVVNRGDNDRILASKDINAKDITEGQVVTVESSDYINLPYTTLAIKVSSDSVKGKGVFLYMTKAVQTDTSLTINGNVMDGTLCFGETGQDYIWIGTVYWKLVAVGAVLLIIACVIVIVLDRKGKSRIAGSVRALKKYRFLIKQLVSRDFKRRYKRSVLGIFWSLLNPMLTMVVQYFVFSNIFKADIPNYGMYLLIGIVAFNFFNEATGVASNSVVSNAQLIKKVYVPKYIYPFTSVMFNGINFLISLVPLVILGAVTKVHLHKALFLSPFFFLCLFIFTMGISLILATMMVYFRDIQFIWSLVTMVWMYATPVFYPESIIPNQYRFVFKINPLYYIITSLRSCIMYGVSPEPIVYIECFLISVGVLILGSYIFISKQDRFILYL